MKRHTHAGAWQDYRRRVRGFVIAWLGGFASIAALLVALDAFGAPEWAPMALGLAWMAVFAWTSIRLQRFPCPRCGKPFFSTTFSYWPFAQECRHCGLPKGQR
jgi:hypothetical protein